MAKNKKIIVEVDGDSAGLQKALNKAESSIKSFGDKAGGGMGDFANKFSGGVGQISGGLTGLVGGVGIAATAFAGLALKINDVVKELNQLSSQSGLSVTYIQQLDKTFRSTGLGMEKLLDINQDVMDKMGDAVVSGGGEFASVIKDLGFNIDEYSEYLDKPDGGIQATLHLMDAMKKAGMTASEQKFALEAIASDASRLGTVYDDLGSKQAVLNDITKQTANVSEEAAENFQEFDRNIQTLTDSGQGYLVSALNPIVESTNDLIETMENFDGSTFWYNLADGAIQFQKQLNKLNLIPGMKYITGASEKGLNLIGGDAKSKSFINEQAEQMATFTKRNDKIAADNFKKQEDKKRRFEKIQKEEAEKAAKEQERAEQKAKSAAEKAQREKEATARKAQAAAEKAAHERFEAEKKLEVAMTEVAESAGDQRLQIFDRQQKELLKTIQETAKLVGKSTEEINAMLDKAKASGDRARTELINSMIGYSDPNQDLKDANSYAVLGLNDTQKSFMADEQEQRINGERNPFTTDNTAKLQEENQRRLELELQLNEQLLGGTEEFEKRKAEIQQRYARESMLIAQQNTQTQMSVLAQGAGDMGTMMEGVFGESSKAASAFFAVQKGINIAKIMMNMQVALSEALSMPFPSNIPAMGKVMTMGAQIVNTAKGINVQGQAHSGIEEVPGSLGKDSTWILQAGERVVSRGQNKQLQEYLDNNTGNSGNNSGNYEVYAPLIVQGNVDGTDDKKFNEMLKKHSQSVNQAVKDAQKRST